MNSWRARAYCQNLFVMEDSMAEEEATEFKQRSNDSNLGNLIFKLLPLLSDLSPQLPV